MYFSTCHLKAYFHFDYEIVLSFLIEMRGLTSKRVIALCKPGLNWQGNVIPSILFIYGGNSPFLFDVHSNNAPTWRVYGI